MFFPTSTDQGEICVPPSVTDRATIVQRRVSLAPGTSTSNQSSTRCVRVVGRVTAHGHPQQEFQNCGHFSEELENCLCPHSREAGERGHGHTHRQDCLPRRGNALSDQTDKQTIFKWIVIDHVVTLASDEGGLSLRLSRTFIVMSSFNTN